MSGKSWRAAEDDLMRAAVGELEGRYAHEMGHWIGELAEWALFMNPMTFDPLVMAGTSPAALAKGREQLAVPNVSRWTAMRRFRYFLEASSRALKRPTSGVIALEPHQSGQPHGHGLLSIEGGLLGQEIRVLGRLWRDYPGNGWIRLEIPRSQQDVAHYSAKYMAKHVSELVMSSSLGRRPAQPALIRSSSQSEPGVGRGQPEGSS